MVTLVARWGRKMKEEEEEEGHTKTVTERQKCQESCKARRVRFDSFLCVFNCKQLNCHSIVHHKQSHPSHKVNGRKFKLNLALLFISFSLFHLSYPFSLTIVHPLMTHIVSTFSPSLSLSSLFHCRLDFFGDGIHDTNFNGELLDTRTFTFGHGHMKIRDAKSDQCHFDWTRRGGYAGDAGLRSVHNS